MKALEVFLLGSQARMTSNKHDGHCMLKFYPLSESQQELTSNNCQVQQCPCKCVLISRMRTHSIWAMLDDKYQALLRELQVKFKQRPKMEH